MLEYLKIGDGYNFRNQCFIMVSDLIPFLPLGDGRCVSKCPWASGRESHHLALLKRDAFQIFCHYHQIRFTSFQSVPLRIKSLH